MLDTFAPTPAPTRRRSAAITGVAPAAIAAVVVTIVRLQVSAGRTVFHLTPDEPGQLAISRFVGGMSRWNMNDHSTWRPAYGTLIAPIYLFSDDPVTTLRAALAVNAVLGGVACALMYLLARRLTAMSPLWCAGAALVVSLAPAVLFTTDWVWAEALVAVLFLAALVAMLRFHESPGATRGILVATLSIGAFSAHSRMLPLAVVTLGLVAVAARARRITVRLAAGLGAYILALFAFVAWYSEWLIDRIWERPHATNSFGGVFAQLAEVGGVIVSAVGQSWYQLTTTAGLAGVGAMVIVRCARRVPARCAVDDAVDRSLRTPGRPAVSDARVVLAATGSLVALSVLFMADRWRSDQLIYGRYNDSVLGPVVIVGLAALATSRRFRDVARLVVPVVAVTAALGVGINALRGDELRNGIDVSAMVLGLHALNGRPSTVHIAAVTVIGIAALVAVALTSIAVRRPGSSGFALLAVGALAVLGWGRTRDVADDGKNGWASAAAVEEVSGAVLAEGDPVRFRLDPTIEDPTANWSYQRQRAMLYQFYLPHNPVYYDGETPPPTPTPYVFAPLADPELSASDAEVVWRDPSVGIGLWKESSGN